MADRNSVTLLTSLILACAGIFIIIWGIQSMAFIINPILLALVITISLLPMVGWLREKGASDAMSMIITILTVVAVLIVVLGLVFVSLTQLSAELATPDLGTSTEEVAPSAEGTTSVPALSLETINDLMDERSRQATVSNLLNGFVVAGVQSIASVAVALVIFIFMLASAVSLPERARRGLTIPPDYWDRIERLTGDVQRYVSVMTVINFLVGMGNTVILWIIGVDFAILWGLLAWVMGYIPTIGFWIALIPPVLLAWATLGAQEALIVFISYVFINGSVQNLVQPRMMGNRLNISPLIILISLFFWGGLLGAVGAILSVPLTLIVLTVLESFSATNWMVKLVRFTDETPSSKAEREAGMNQIRSLLGRARNAVTGSDSNHHTPPS